MTRCTKALSREQTWRVEESTVAMFRWSRSPGPGLAEERTSGHRATFRVEKLGLLTGSSVAPFPQLCHGSFAFLFVHSPGRAGQGTAEARM